MEKKLSCHAQNLKNIIDKRIKIISLVIISPEIFFLI